MWPIRERSQDLKAHEEGSTNPCRLERHRSQRAAGKTVAEQTAGRGEEEERWDGGGGGNEKGQ